MGLFGGLYGISSTPGAMTEANRPLRRDGIIRILMVSTGASCHEAELALGCVVWPGEEGIFDQRYGITIAIADAKALLTSTDL